MPRGAVLDQAIIQLASTRASVVHARELRVAGISRDAVRHRVSSGAMTEVLPSTYLVGAFGGEPSLVTLCSAGIAHAGAGAFVDDVTAATMLDAWNRHDGSIHIGVTGTPPRTSRPPFEFHGHREDRSSSIVQVQGVPIAGPVDLCVQLARSLTKWQVAFVIRGLAFHGLVDLEVLDAHATALVHVPWITTLRDGIELVRCDSAGSRGPAEDRYLELLVRAGIDEPLVNVRGAALVVRDEPDFLWRSRRVNVEIDGRYHDDPIQRRQDDLRDEAVSANGIAVYRLEARDVFMRPRAVIEMTIRALRGELIATEQTSRRVNLSRA
jgi:very-short-patch-repair endonuclease